MDNIKSFFSKNNFEYYENFDMAKLSSIKIGGKARLVVFPKNTSELKKVVLKLFKTKTQFKIVGNASNLLFVSDLEFVVVATSKMINEVEITGQNVCVSAGTMLPFLCDLLAKNGLSGLEGLCGIPATVGGAIMCGAGAFGFNIFDKLISILVVEDGKVDEILRADVNFKHHYSNLCGKIILSAKFLFEKKKEYDIISLQNKFSYMRTKSQPSGFSLGCVYQKTLDNSAGFFIERAGLKGKRFGGLMVSNKHANFFVNDGTATAVDFLRLMAFVEMNVSSHFGIDLLPEIEKVGEKNETNSRLSYPFK